MNPVYVSDLAHYHRCPRQVYFRHRRHETPVTRGRYETMILRELSMRLPYTELSEECIRSAIMEIRDYFEDLFPEEKIQPELLDSAFEKVLVEVDQLLSGLMVDIEQYGPWEVPWREDYHVRSDRLRLSGIVDKIFRDGPTPCIIRSGRPPTIGAWEVDRLQLTAYTMILEEELKAPIEQGIVEYIRFGFRRIVKIRGRDRRRVLRTRDRILRIKDGALPESSEEFCESCLYASLCLMEPVTLALRLNG